MVGANLKGELTEQQWFDAVRRWEVSGLSQAAFCKNEGVAAWRFSGFKRKLYQLESKRKAGARQRQNQRPARTKFVQVEFAEASESDQYELPWLQSKYAEGQASSLPCDERREILDPRKQSTKVIAEILLGGWQIRVHAGADVNTLKNLLRAVVEY